MTMQNPSGYGGGPPQGGSLTDVVTQLQGVVAQLSAIAQAFTNRELFGSFTMTATASVLVAQPGVEANSQISITPLNAPAATLMGGSKSLYVSTITPGSGFTVATADGTNAAGTEQFQYQITTPI